MRKCHFCREAIDDAVRVCPHCGEDLIHRPSRRDKHVNAGIVASIQHGIARLDEVHPSLPLRTMFLSSVLFGALLLIYGVYLHGVVTSTQTEFTLDELVWPLAKYCLISGAPFAVLAALDPAWRSEHAAPVALGAWVVVFEYTSQKYGGSCPKTFAIFFVPLVFSALAAHTMVRGSTGA